MKAVNVSLLQDGYLLLAERLRSSEERAVVRSVLEKTMKAREHAPLRQRLQAAQLSARRPLCPASG